VCLSLARQTHEGKVLAVGPGRRTMNGALVPLDVAPGDIVALPEFGGVSVELGGEVGKEYAVYREEEILAVVTDD